MNYLLDEKDVISTFKNVYSSLKDDGTFIFDVDSLYKMNVILNDYHEHEQDDEFVFMWDVETLDHGYVHHHVYIEDKVENDKVEEEHYQKTYSLDTYLQWLNDCGFNNVKYFSDFNEYKEECERIIFVCRKD